MDDIEDSRLPYNPLVRTEFAMKLGIAATIRWVALLAIGLLLASQGSSVPTLLGLVAFGAIYNLAFSINAQRTGLSRRQLLVGLGLDALLAIGLFYVSRTLLGPLVWVGLLPIVSAAWGFGLLGGVGTAVGMAVIFAGLAMIDIPLSEIPSQMLAPAAVFIISGLLAGFAANQIQLRLNQTTGFDESRRAENERHMREQSAVLQEIATALNSSLVVDQVLESALDLGVDSLLEPHETVSRAVGGILLFADGGLRIAAGRRLAAKDIDRVLPGQQGALAELQQSGEAALLSHPTNDPEFSLVSGLQNCQSLYCTPLRAGIDLFGVFFFAHPDEIFFTAERRMHIDLIARQVMVALQNAQLYEALNEEKERILHIEEQARNQLARNLHDGPTQSVAAIAMRTNLARRLLAKDPTAAGDELYKLEDLARRTTKEIRHMLFTLRPQSLESAGLVVALNDLAAQMEETEERKIHIDAQPDVTAHMDLGKQTVLFHIAAEALTNAKKHANAQHIDVRLSKTQRDVVLLEVQDDGQGFTAQQESAKHETDGALGLNTLRERVELISGIMQLDSIPGRGTHLRVWAPLNEQAAERLRLGK